MYIEHKYNVNIHSRKTLTNKLNCAWLEVKTHNIQNVYTYIHIILLKETAENKTIVTLATTNDGNNDNVEHQFVQYYREKNMHTNTHILGTEISILGRIFIPITN